MLGLTRNIGSVVHIQIRGANQAPATTLRLQVRKLYTLAMVVGITWFVLFVGTLFFFREIEINRKLIDRLLELETQMALVATERKNPVKAERQEPAAEENWATVTRELMVAPVVVPSVVTAHLGELNIECTQETCDTRAYLTPASPGIAEGSVLLVLEAEVTRIGGADPNVPARKQFISYPGFKLLDDLDATKATALEKRPFRFTRALPTNIQFKIGSLHQPVAINLYLFDSHHNLIHHERKSIERDH